MNALKGFWGEIKLRFAMAFLLSWRYKVLSNVTIQFSNGDTTQIDHIVVSRYGIFVVETKNYRGTITIDEYTGYWTQSFARSSYQFYSPLKQNDGHISAMRYLLKTSDYPMINIVSFVGEAEFSENTMPDNVATSILRTIRLISSYKHKLIKPSEVGYIFNTIQSRRMPNTWRTKRIHLKNMKNR